MKRIKLKKYVTLTLAVVATGIILGLSLKTDFLQAQTTTTEQKPQLIARSPPEIQKMLIKQGYNPLAFNHTLLCN